MFEMKTSALFLAATFLKSCEAFVPASKISRADTTVHSSLDDLKDFAKSTNPILNYYDPLQLGSKTFWELNSDETIGWLRHSEIKHGRVAMFAFVGYCVQSNFHWPWHMTLAGENYPSIDLSPEAQWDALPVSARSQIFAVIAFLEFFDENGGGGLLKHYTKGRQPGKYPSFDIFGKNIHPVANLYDPLGFNNNMSDELKARRLASEINNGRLAMIGIFGFLAADKVPGSVPLLKSIAQPYDGQVMSPFTPEFTIWPSA